LLSTDGESVKIGKDVNMSRLLLVSMCVGEIVFALSALAFAWAGSLAFGAETVLPSGAFGVAQVNSGTVKQEPAPVTEPSEGPDILRKQRHKMLKYNFEKMKEETDELLELAKSLQDDMNKSNENVLSLHLVEKADKIEKLAKKIKGTAKGY
jgi:hypothetical protein